MIHIIKDIKMKYKCIFNSIIGNITLYSEDNYLTGLCFENQDKNFIDNDYILNNDIEIFKQTRRWLNEYFNGLNPKNNLKIKPKGTDFQKEVWKIIMEIPYGKTLSYKDIANKMAIKRNKEHMSSQAVGNAIHANPINIIIPCHRVINSNGKLGGYNSSLVVKLKLLEIENNKNGESFMDNEKLIEKIASYEHDRWSKWQKYLHNVCIKNSDGSLTIPKEYVIKWEKQLNTIYDDLSESEKDSDRKEAKRILNIIKSTK